MKAHYHKKNVSQVDQLTVAMLGPKKKPELHANASETRNMVPFAVQLLEQFRDVFGKAGPFLLSAGKALMSYYDLVASGGRNMSEPSRRKLMDHCLTHLTCFKKACRCCKIGCMKPKHHLFYHLTARL